MYVKNENAGTDSDKVAACTDLGQLLTWQLKVYETIESVKLQIDNLRTENDNVHPKKWLPEPLGMTKKKNFLRLQEVLYKQIEHRIIMLDRGDDISKLERERDFWKAKVKYLAPKTFEKYCAEIAG